MEYIDISTVEALLRTCLVCGFPSGFMLGSVVSLLSYAITRVLKLFDIKNIR